MNFLRKLKMFSLIPRPSLTAFLQQWKKARSGKKKKVVREGLGSRITCCSSNKISSRPTRRSGLAKVRFKSER